MERGQLDNMRQSLLDEGFIDELFVQMETLQTEANSNFVEETITMFYTTDSARYLKNIEQALEKTPIDFSELDSHVARFKGCCSTVGARRVANKCTEFREYCRAGNRDLEGCKMALQQLKEELATLKDKLEAYFLLGRQVRTVEAVGGPDRAMDLHNSVVVIHELRMQYMLEGHHFNLKKQGKKKREKRKKEKLVPRSNM